jgi:hypothetical protein
VELHAGTASFALPRRLPRLVATVLLVVATTLILFNFNIGFRTTADQIATTELVATHSFSQILRSCLDAAIAQGRIGWLIAMSLLSLGAYYGDFLLYPLIAVGIMPTIAYATFRWVELLTGGSVALPMMALFLAVLPVGMHHWLPNAYAMQFLPLAVALVARNELLRRKRTSAAASTLLLILVLAGALTYELFFSLLLAMTLIEAALVFSGSTAAAPGLSRRFVIGQAGLLLLALATYLAFRLTFPSGYDGNQPPDPARFREAAETTLRHLLTAPSIGLVVARWQGLAISPTYLAGAMLVGAGLAAAAWRLAWPSRRRAVFWVGAGVLMALAAAAPVATNAKYIGWCLVSGECTFLNSRAVLAGLAIAGVALPVAAFGQRIGAVLLVVSVAVLGSLTYLVNVGERHQLDYGRRAESTAKRFICESRDTTADPLPTARALAAFPVSFHPHYTPERKVQYWVSYIGLLRAQPLWLCP